jgi:hypothetical protein
MQGGQLRQYQIPTQLTNTAKRSETDPLKAQAQQFYPLGGLPPKARISLW